MKKLKLFFVISLLFVLLIPQISQATMSASQIIVNQKTKECAWFNEGDECQECKKPSGWESYLGSDEYSLESNECPLGYTMVKDLKINCHAQGWSAFTNAMCAGFIARRYAVHYKILSILPILLIILVIFLIIFFKKRNKLRSKKSVFVLLILILLIVFLFPKKCDYTSGEGTEVRSCGCFGLKESSLSLDEWQTKCYGIVHNCESYSYR